MPSLWLDSEPVVLASASRARLMLLTQAGIPVEVRKPEIDERALEDMLGADSGRVALGLARAKAGMIAHTVPDRWVVAGDQTLALGAERFHKPADRDAARAQLNALSGRTHELHAAVVLLRGGEVRFETVARATLRMRTLTPDFLERYLDVAGPAALSSVGGYQLEGVGAALFEAIEGDYFTILGLPLLPLIEALRGQGLLAG